MYGKSICNIWIQKYGKEESDRLNFLRALKNAESSSGKNNPMYGKSLYDVCLQKYGKEEADQRKSKRLEAAKQTNEQRSAESKKRNFDKAIQLSKALKRENCEKYINDKRRGGKAAASSNKKYIKNSIEKIVEN